MTYRVLTSMKKPLKVHKYPFLIHEMTMDSELILYQEIIKLKK